MKDQFARAQLRSVENRLLRLEDQRGAEKENFERVLAALMVYLGVYIRTEPEHVVVEKLQTKTLEDAR